MVARLKARQVAGQAAAAVTLFLCALYAANFYDPGLVGFSVRGGTIAADVLSAVAFVLSLRIRSMSIAGMLTAGGLVIQVPPVQAIAEAGAVSVPGPIFGVIFFAPILVLGVIKAVGLRRASPEGADGAREAVRKSAMSRLEPKTWFGLLLVSVLPRLSMVSPTAGLLVPTSSLALTSGARPQTEDGTTRAGSRRALRLLTVVLALLFLLSAALNLGARIPLGVTELSFLSPSSSIATFEVVIALVLLGGAAVPNLYVCGGGYLLAAVGIAEGLLSPEVQGLARSLHETMVPFAVAGWLLILLEARTVYRTGTGRGPSARRREIVAALQFFVGALVTLGGAAYAAAGTYPVGTALGLVHLSVGLAGLFGGYAFLRRKPWSGTFLVAVNGVTIAYSAFSETVAELYALLPPGVTDSLIGTIVAIVVSAVIIYLLSHGRDS